LQLVRKRPEVRFVNDYRCLVAGIARTVEALQLGLHSTDKRIENCSFAETG